MGKSSGKVTGSSALFPGDQDRKAAFEAEIQAAETITLSPTEVKMEACTGKIFQKQELKDSELSYVAVRCTLHVMGIESQPERRQAFGEYLWSCCAIGTSHQNAPANNYQVWLELLTSGRLWALHSQTGELLILVPANNTDYNNVSAYLEAFWS